METATKDSRLTLDAAQAMAAKGLQEADQIAGHYRKRVLELEEQVDSLQTVLTHKQAALERLRSERDVSVALVREHFSLYRDLMLGEVSDEQRPAS